MESGQNLTGISLKLAGRGDERVFGAEWITRTHRVRPTLGSLLIGKNGKEVVGESPGSEASVALNWGSASQILRSFSKPQFPHP